MEFNEKLQELRKNKGLTQEELASSLYVSRTAISKWESGRGYPGIESLKQIAKFFSVSLDSLLSGDEILTIAEEEGKQKEKRICKLVFGLLDVGVLLLLFLPFFGQKSGDMIESVSLLMLTQVSSIFKTMCLVFVGAVVLWGIVTLAFQNTNFSLFEKSGFGVSLFLNTCGVLLFIVSPNQTYVAAFLFVMLVIKASLLIKKR